MKVIVSIFLVFSFVNVFAQQLNNTEWTQIKVERKDGSKVIDRQNTEKTITKYSFKEKTVLVSHNNEFTDELPFTINDKVLTIGEISKYQIDTIDSEVLVLTQISSKNLSDDKINRYIFLNRHSLFQYLIETKEIEIIADSLIECNNFFAPTLYDNISKLLKSEFDYQRDNKIIYGNYTISPSGYIKNIEFEKSTEFSKNEIEKIGNILKTTNGNWILPETPKPLYFKIRFGITFSYFKPNSSSKSFSGVNFFYSEKSITQGLLKPLTRNEIIEADNYFNKGNQFIQNEKYDKAVYQFTKCIEIDSLYIDAYYNMAFCYKKLNNSNSACETWSKLRSMGQKQGEYLYIENCK